MKDFLKVFLWEKEVGRLAWDDKRKLAYFNYSPEFLKGNLDIAPIAASIHDKSSALAIYGETERIYQKLPSFIADSLPDAWGNQLFEQWRKSQHLSNRDITPIEKLAFIGKRGMGALEFVPEIKREISLGNIDLNALFDLAQKVVEDKENLQILPEEALTMQSLISVGTSAGGRQPKGIIAMNSTTGEIRSGQIVFGPDFEYYIIKFGNKDRSLAELEQTYYEMAINAGIQMMESRLLEVEGTKHFLTRRFDRSKSGKIHTQTLAAMKPDADSYEDIITICRDLHLPENDCQEVFRRTVFNILANNTDDHNKNFAFMMGKNGEWRLTPAYDMTYIFDSGGFLPNRDHCLMVGGKIRDISYEDILSFAEECGIRNPETVIQKVESAIMEFRTLAQKNGVREEWIGRIEACLNENLSSWGCATKSSAMSYEESGFNIKTARIEAAYKGNYHLIAIINGHEYKYVIRTGTNAHGIISSKGISHVTDDEVKSFVREFLLTKKQLKAT